MVLLVFNCSYSATKIMPENDWKKKGLKGKVSQMIATTYKYDRNGKLDKKVRVVTHFNEQGYIKEEIHYSNDIVSYIIFKEYGKDGLLIKSNDYQNVYYTHEYEYDKNGNLVETKREKEKKLQKYGNPIIDQFIITDQLIIAAWLIPIKHLKTIKILKITIPKTCIICLNLILKSMKQNNRILKNI